MPEEVKSEESTAVVDAADVATDSAEQDTAVESVETTGEGDEKKPHPLSQDGDRFKQVWARAKGAESELHKEREERIRLEERLKAQTDAKEKEATKQAPISWDALETAIAEGRVTRAQAMEHWTQQTKQGIERDTLEKFDKKLQQTQRDTMLLADINRYKQVIPTVMQPGTEERLKYEQKYAYLTQTLGYQPGYATELAAVNMAFGDIGEVEKRQRVTSTQARGEISMETHGTGSPQHKKSKDPVEQLSAREREYYEKRIKTRNGYSSWDDVRAELNWVRGNGKK